MDLIGDDRQNLCEFRLSRRRFWRPQHSLRLNHVTQAALAGAHIATLPFKIVDTMFDHPLTDKGLDAFLKDWAKVFEEVPASR